MDGSKWVLTCGCCICIGACIMGPAAPMGPIMGLPVGLCMGPPPMRLGCMQAAELMGCMGCRAGMASPPDSPLSRSKLLLLEEDAGGVSMATEGGALEAGWEGAAAKSAKSDEGLFTHKARNF